MCYDFSLYFFPLVYNFVASNSFSSMQTDYIIELGPSIDIPRNKIKIVTMCTHKLL